MSGSSDKPQDLVVRKLHAVTFQWVLLAVKEGARSFKKGGGGVGEAARPGPCRIYLDVSLHPSAFTSPPLKNSWAGNK